MEGELGAFLSLIGYTLQDHDLTKLGLTHGMVDDPTTISNIANQIFTTYSSMYDSVNKWENEDWSVTLANRLKADFDKNPNDIYSNLPQDERLKLDFITQKEYYNYPFRPARINEQDIKNNVLLNMLKSAKISKENSLEGINIKDESSYRNHRFRAYTNSDEFFRYIALENFGFEEAKGFSLAHVQKDIHRLFRFNSVREIYEAMKEENSIFSEWCLEQMDKKSPLALEVALKMLNKAKKMNYYEVIKMEINVAKNMILKNNDFEIAMANKLINTKSGTKNKNIFGYTINEVSQDLITEIFEDNTIDNINLDIKPNHILPKDLRDHPDAFRLWLNEHPRAVSGLRLHFDRELQNYLIQTYGIDTRDTNLTIEKVRNVFSKIHTKSYIENKYKEKFENLIQNEKFLENFIEKRRESIDAFAKDENRVKEVVNRKLNELFVNNFNKTCEDILTKCKDIRSIEKEDSMSDLKNGFL